MKKNLQILLFRSQVINNTFCNNKSLINKMNKK